MFAASANQIFSGHAPSAHAVPELTWLGATGGLGATTLRQSQTGLGENRRGFFFALWRDRRFAEARNNSRRQNRRSPGVFAPPRLPVFGRYSHCKPTALTLPSKSLRTVKWTSFSGAAYYVASESKCGHSHSHQTRTTWRATMSGASKQACGSVVLMFRYAPEADISHADTSGSQDSIVLICASDLSDCHIRSRRVFRPAL